MKKFLAILCLVSMASAATKPVSTYLTPPKGLPSGNSKQQQGQRSSQPNSISSIFSPNIAPQVKQIVDFSRSIQSSYNAAQGSVSSGTAPAPTQLAQPSTTQFVSSVQQPQQQTFSPLNLQYLAAPQQQQFNPSVSPFSPPIQQQQQQLSPVPPQYVHPVLQQQNAGASQQVQTNYLSPVGQYQIHNFQQPSQQQTIVSKDIYIHSAPEEFEEVAVAAPKTLPGPVRKNYRIVFIKAPTPSLKFNLEALKRTQAATEEKTVIYVLSKKPDLSEIQGQFVAAQTEQKTSKPEVYFIKYKTQEEANRAQQEIQAQYDSLGGSTHISDEGVAPVHSVIGGSTINVGNIGGRVSTSNVFQGANNVGSQQFSQQSLQTSQATSAGSSLPINFGSLTPQKYVSQTKVNRPPLSN